MRCASPILHGQRLSSRLQLSQRGSTPQPSAAALVASAGRRGAAGVVSLLTAGGNSTAAPAAQLLESYGYPGKLQVATSPVKRPTKEAICFFLEEKGEIRNLN